MKLDGVTIFGLVTGVVGLLWVGARAIHRIYRQMHVTIRFNFPPLVFFFFSIY